MKSLQHGSVYTITLLWVSLCLACNAGNQPSMDTEITVERACDGLDDDSDGTIDEGLLNACLGCTELDDTYCTLTSIVLQSKTPEPVVPVALQYRIYQAEQRRIGPHLCSIERIQSVQPIVLNTPIMLTQGIPVQRWSSNPELNDDDFAGFMLDGETPIKLDTEGTRVSFSLNPPPPPSVAAQIAVKQCVDHFDERVEMAQQFTLEQTYDFFLGGRTQLASDPDEIATSFFVLAGETEPGVMALYDLIASRPYTPDAVRCSISNSAQTSRPMDANGYQLSAQATVEASVSRDNIGTPVRIRDFQSINFTPTQVQVSLAHLAQWGPPIRMDFSRSGTLNGLYESQRIICEIDAQAETLSFEPDTILPTWLGEASPQEIVRLQWSQSNAPFSMHPKVIMREALTIQRNRPVDSP